MGNAFDSVDDSVLKQLNSKDAVKLLHKLIYSEAKRLDISADLISVPYEIDTPDGGIDAVFRTGVPITDSELIFEGKTYYQVKSGENVQLTEVGLKKVLCEDRRKKGVTERDLKPKVRKIAEENGTLVLFLTGRSAPDIEDALKNTREVIEHYLPDTKLTIRIVQADNIIAMLDNFLVLRHDLLHIQGFPGLLFHEWERQPLMRNYFEDDERRTKKIENLCYLVRSTLPEDRVIRVTGYPGIGKTRTVLEAVREEDLWPLVIYFDKPSHLIETNFLVEMGTRRENEAIVIVDECDHHSHIQLVSALAGSKSNIKLVTIYNEPSNTVKDVKNFDLNEDEILASESIVSILKSYGLPDDVAERWEPFCGGSPRVAHMIAENLSRNAGNLLSRASRNLAMERILANTEQLESEVYKKRKNVLSWLSLFHKFGWSREFAQERKFIINKIREKTGYSEDDVETVIQELKDRKVLQGDKTLYVSPRLLHVQAWVWWWGKYGGSFDMAEMRQSTFEGEIIKMSDSLHDWFIQMFEYAREVEGASEVVRKLLAVDGSLSNETELIEALSGNFFLSLTKADPESALLILENWFEKKTDDELRAYRQNRMTLVRVLEIMAVWGSLFTRAAELMLRLAVTEEDHTYSNNSEGTFADLFSNGWGKLAPTEAAPSERFPIMEKAVKSSDDRERLMGLNAISHALEASHFTRIVGAEVQGLREEPKLWSPETYREIYDAIRAAWLLLLEVLPSLDQELKDEAIKIINNHIRGLLAINEDALLYLGEYAELVKEDFIPKGDAVDSINIIRRYDTKRRPLKVIKAIQELSDYLEGSDFTSRLKRYIAYNSMEDWWGDDEDIVKSSSKVAVLVRETMANPELLDENTWLFTKEAKNGYRFGQGLAEIDEKHTLLNKLVNLQKTSDRVSEDEASLIFLSGYLCKLQKLNFLKWQETLDLIATDEELVHWYAEACWRSELNDHNAQVIIKLIKEDKVKLSELGFFRFGTAVKNLSKEIFKEWIEYLLAQNTLEAIAIAVGLFFSFYIFQEESSIPQDLALRVITAKSLMEKDRQIARAIDYGWFTIVEKYIKQYSEQTEALLDFMLDNFGEDDTVFDSYDYAKRALNEIIKVDPVMAWKKITGCFNKNLKEFKLQLWLGGGVSFGDRPDGAITLFPKKLILDWIDEDPENRANQVARMIPHDFDDEPANETWYAVILNKYGHMKRVQSSLHANLGTESWSGSESLHYANKLEKIKRFAELNKNSANIQKWVANVIDNLNKRVQSARINEERRGF